MNLLECGVDSNKLPPWGNWDNTLIRFGGARYSQRFSRAFRPVPGPAVILDYVGKAK